MLQDTSKLTYAALRAEQSRQRNSAIKIAPATYARYGETCDHTGAVELRYITVSLHGHDIATLYESGAIALYTCGYETTLTRSRLAALLHASPFNYGVCICLKRICLTAPSPRRYIPVQYRYEAKEMGTGLYIETDGTVYDGGYSDEPLYTPEPPETAEPPARPQSAEHN